MFLDTSGLLCVHNSAEPQHHVAKTLFKGQKKSEAPIIPVSAALGNALANATGIRFHSLPLSPDRIFSCLAELH
jgi:CO/xanthine dehydrogenase Mo-binding subunit